MAAYSNYICWLSWQAPVDSYKYQEERMILVIKVHEIFFSTIGINGFLLTFFST